VGAFGSEAFAAAEHARDRLGEAAGEVDLAYFGAALFADPGFRLSRKSGWVQALVAA
jgi:hypothetical protein